MKMITLLLSAGLAFIVQNETSHARFDCPEAPAQFSRDVTAETEGKASALRGLGGAELKNKTQVITHDLWEKFPNQDRVYLGQTLISFYCNFLYQSMQLSDQEKLDRMDIVMNQVLGQGSTPKPKGLVPQKFTDEPPPQFLKKGSIIKSQNGGSYKIERSLYHGETSIVYKATNNFKESVAIKLFLRGLDPGSSAYKGFSQEYGVMKTLHHRNIVKVHDTGIVGGYPFYVMEYLAGGNLRVFIESHHPIPGPAILSVASQLADAIDFAHAQGVVHRDIKPENILLESDLPGRVALGDFGIAAMIGAVHMDITVSTPSALGSIAYVSPETITESKISKASDIYSFGTLLFELIAGEPPFHQKEGVAVLFGKAANDAPDIRNYRMVSSLLAGRISKTLSRNPSDRPSSARAVFADLESEISGL